MNKTKQGLSAAAYAKSRGLSGSYVARLVRDGRIPTLPDGSIDAEQADRARHENVAPRINPGDWNRPVDLKDIEPRVDGWLTNG